MGNSQVLSGVECTECGHPIEAHLIVRSAPNATCRADLGDPSVGCNCQVRLTRQQVREIIRDEIGSPSGRVH